MREEGGLPPFGRLAALIVSANEHDEAMGFARTLLSAAPQAEGLRLFGPADAPVAMVRGRHRVRLLAQSPRISTSRGYVRFWLNSAERPTRQSAGAGRYRPDEFLLRFAAIRPESRAAAVRQSGAKNRHAAARALRDRLEVPPC